jgi:hypothetical protein
VTLAHECLRVSADLEELRIVNVAAGGHIDARYPTDNRGDRPAGKSEV